MDGVYGYNYRRIKKLCRSSHNDNIFINLLLRCRSVGMDNLCLGKSCAKDYIPGDRIYLCYLNNIPWDCARDDYYCNVGQNDPVIWTVHKVRDGQVSISLGVGFHLMELCRSMMFASSKYDNISVGKVSYKTVFRCVTEHLAWRLKRCGIGFAKKELLFETGYNATRKHSEQVFTSNIVYYMQRQSKKRIKKSEAFKFFDYGKSSEEWCSSEYEEPVSLCI